MRPWLALSLIAALAAGSAGAQTSAPAAKARASSGPTLRGAQEVDVETPRETTAQRSARVAVVQPLPPPPAAPTPLMSMLPTREPPLCRMTCAQSYYFCLAASDATEDCSGGFGQCSARCDRPTG